MKKSACCYEMDTWRISLSNEGNDDFLAHCLSFGSFPPPPFFPFILGRECHYACLDGPITHHVDHQADLKFSKV